MVFRNFYEGRYDDGFNNVMKYSVYRTTPSAFRKIYNLIIPVLDKVMTVQPQVNPDLVRLLVRLNIVLEYQKRRGMIDDDLADGIKTAIDEIRRSLGNPKGVDQARELARALRDSLDAFLAYVIYAKRGEEEL
ncbi:hypothetical protein VMUT_1491 [Vulcanisaeta moutnovskia 768-28]|uniref:CRISPR type III-B/RAMP module-associated protein Cmr5 n=2 Tax=Vulcanisaeta TaxID=164450 RepID=F0QTI3_VULM7|nr:hypothetical protein VMUT_1491 [Vulcanisaeta moutnovskia 768-28]